MVNIVPEAEIFSIFRSLNYKSWFALAEFVDNSVQSYTDWKRDPTGAGCPPVLEIEIEIFEEDDKPKIRITDNARGIALEDFDRAFKVASRPPDATGLSEFGMGMKTAGFWFANKWHVRTSHYGEAIERMMSFDLSTILKDKLSDIEPLEVPGTREKSYTVIELEDLNQIPRTKTVPKVKSYLASMYRRHIASGELRLVVDGEELKFDAPGILKAPWVRDDSPDPELVDWKLPIDISLDENKRITGWVGIQSVGSTKSNGFALFRRGRLVQGGPDDNYSPEEICGSKGKHQWKRLYGELDVHGLGVTHTKDAINWGGFEEEFIEKLKAAMKEGQYDFIYQAATYRLDSEPSKEDKAALADQVSHPTIAVPQILKEISESISNSGNSPIADSIESHTDILSASRNEIVLEDGSQWIFEDDIIDDPTKNLFDIAFERNEDKSANTVRLIFNASHPFVKTYADDDLGNLQPLTQFLGVLSLSLGYYKAQGGRHQAIVEALNKVARRWVNGR